MFPLILSKTLESNISYKKDAGRHYNKCV